MTKDEIPKCEDGEMEKESVSVGVTREVWLVQALRVQRYNCKNGLSICIVKAGWITDYILAVVSLSFCLVLLAMGPSRPTAHNVDTIAVWHAGFLGASFVSALLGGIIHHYCHFLVKGIESGSTPHDPHTEAILNQSWGVILAVGSVPNFCLFASASWVLFKSQSTASLVTYIGAGVYMAVALVVGVTKKIKIHIIASLPTMLYFIGCSIYRFSTSAAQWNTAAGAGLLLSGVIVAFKLSPSRSFNHNALLHVTLCAVCVCMFISAVIGL